MFRVFPAVLAAVVTCAPGGDGGRAAEVVADGGATDSPDGPPAEDARAARERQQAEHREEECRLRAAAAIAALPGAMEVEPIPLAALCTGEGLRIGALTAAAGGRPGRPWDGDDLLTRSGANAAGRRRSASFVSEIETKQVSKGVIEARLPDDRLAIRIDQASGGDVFFRPDQHVLVGSLTEGESWRREVDSSLRLLRSEAVGLTVTGGYFETRQPVLWRGATHGVGAFTDWKENSVADLGLSLDLLDRTFRYTAAFSGSDYGRTEAPRFNLDNRGTTRRKFERDGGQSWWHRLEADLWKGRDGSASVYGLHGVTEPAYYSLQRRSDSPVYYDGESEELGGVLRLGDKALSLTYRSVTDDFLAMRETKGRLKTGPLTIAVSQGSWMFFDDGTDDSGWWLRDRFWKGGVRLSVDGLLGSRVDPDGVLSRLLPDSVTVKGSRTWRSSSFLADQPPDIKTRAGLDFAWTGESFTTDVFLSHMHTDRWAAGLESADSEEVTLEFMQSFFGDWWDVSAYVSLSDGRYEEIGIPSRDQSYGGGVSFSIDREEYPKLSVGLDLNRFESLFPDIDYGIRDDGINFNVTLDLSKYLPEADPERKPYLKIKAYSDLSLSRETESGRTVDAGQTFVAFFGMKF